MPKMTNPQVMNEFVRRSMRENVESHTGNLYIAANGDKLMNYGTVLAQFIDGTLYLNQSKYSSTTSKIQGQLRNEVSRQGLPNVKYVTDHVSMWEKDLSNYIPQLTK